jgi:hypothetical protein
MKGGFSAANEEANQSLASIDAKGFHRVTKEFIRADNATQYSALDCLAAASPSITTQNIPLAARVVGGSGTIVRAVMKTDMLTWTNPISVAIYDLALPAAFIADNDAFDAKYADSDNVVAVLEFPEFRKDATGAAGSFVKSVLGNLNIPYRCAPASTNLTFQSFLPSGTPTPANLQKFKLNIGLVRD